MEIPVLIPVYNEQDTIARLLRALPKDVDPMVIANGTTDQTLEIAEFFGAKTFDIEEQGKMLAIQHGLRHLGQRALDPILLIDADTVPLRPDKWRDGMVSLLEPHSEHPVVVSGPIWFTENDGTVSMSTRARSLLRLGDTFRSRRTAAKTGLNGAQYGPNQGIHIQNDKTLERVLALKNYWPMQDVALTEAIVAHEDGIFKQSLDIKLLALKQASAHYQPFHEFFTKGIEATNKKVIQSYIDGAPEGSEPYTPSA